MQLHIATQYLVDWQGLNIKSWDFTKLLDELILIVDDHNIDAGEDLILWESEDGTAWELSKPVLRAIADVAPQHKEFCEKLIENSPDYNDFVRVELF